MSWWLSVMALLYLRPGIGGFYVVNVPRCMLRMHVAASARVAGVRAMTESKPQTGLRRPQRKALPAEDLMILDFSASMISRVLRRRGLGHDRHKYLHGYVLDGNVAKLSCLGYVEAFH